MKLRHLFAFDESYIRDHLYAKMLDKDFQLLNEFVISVYHSYKEFILYSFELFHKAFMSVEKMSGEDIAFLDYYVLDHVKQFNINNFYLLGIYDSLLVGFDPANLSSYYAKEFFKEDLNLTLEDYFSGVKERSSIPKEIIEYYSELLISITEELLHKMLMYISQMLVDEEYCFIYFALEKDKLVIFVFK